MSFKYRAVPDGEGRWVLPKVGKMRVEAVAFLSEGLYEISEEGMWAQLADAASYEGVTGVYAMPDCHVGYGVPVGSVVVTDDVVIQAASGYDISCGVLYMRTGLRAADVVDMASRKRWIEEVELRIATGVGSHRPVHMARATPKLVQDVLRHGARPLGVSEDVCERQFIEVSDSADLESIPEALERAPDQLGSVGGGNHFVEMQVDEESGEVFVMVHCGSRGYGYKTANHFFYEAAELRGIPKNRREEAWLRIDEPLGRRYWDHHNSAANYAVANRHVIANGVRVALREVYGEAAEAEVYYEISHNLVQEETLVLPDGTTKRGFVHRKGATRAFPAGHPSLAGTPWQLTGHPCLIPGSMYHGAAVLFAEPGAHASACSVNHGSGRVMARGRAKRELAEKQGAINEEMRTVRRTLGGVEVEGIATNTEDVVLDECAHVYKDLDWVLRSLELSGIARVDRRLYPVANIKGVD